MTSRCDFGLHRVTLLNKAKYPASLVQSNSSLPPKLLRRSDLQTWWAIRDVVGQEMTHQNNVPFMGLGLEDLDTCFFPWTDQYRRTAFHLFVEMEGAAAHPPEYAQCMNSRAEIANSVQYKLN